MITSIPGRIGDDEPLMNLLRRIWLFFIIDVVVIVCEFREIKRLIIREPAESFWIKRPFPFFGFHFFDGLGNNEGPLSHVIEFADLFRPKSGIAAINELLTSEIT